PDCAKKIHHSRLFKGVPRYERRRERPAVRRKFSVLHPSEEDSSQIDTEHVKEDESQNTQNPENPDQKDETG
ncbi:MAG: hypothetical protein QXK90_03380, partial [Candidatus Parvarchaeota archaeon]